MASRIAKTATQFHYLLYELHMIANKRWWRYFTMWTGTGTGVIVSYRLDRAGYLFFGDPWTMLRVGLWPVFLLLRVLSYAHDVHYKADIGRGLLILHASLGVVISGQAVIGENLILTGGNCIGGRDTLRHGDLVLGNNVSLGANAVILGPVCLGSNITIGAGAVVINDAADNVVLVGVPARVVGARQIPPDPALLDSPSRILV